MTDNIVTIVQNDVTLLLDANTKIVHLRAPDSGQDKSLHDVITDTNYQVPTGKKFTIFHIIFFDPNATAKLESTTAADATTGAVTILDPTTAGLDGQMFISGAIAADLYLTVTTSGTIVAAELFGIEENA